MLNLKKQKITLSLKQQDEWEEYFNKYKNECCTFARQIHAADTEIDRLVYALYGLTEEEMKIVENNETMEYNLYCDESCHLEHDRINVMVLGAIWCAKEKKQEISGRIREIKSDFGLAPGFEIKWNKVSPAQKGFYLRLIDYFFDDNDIHFRALIVPDKSELNHGRFNQTHDEFYYKMYFDLLKVIFIPSNRYNVYIDIKDTRSQHKVEKLAEVLCTSKYDFDKRIINRIQQIRSHEGELLPLADLLVGAIAYHCRNLQSNSAKLTIIRRIQERSGYSLNNSTLYREDKLNLFFWKSR